MTELTVTELRHRLLEVIRGVEESGDSVLVTRHGRSVARVVPVRPAGRDVIGADVGRVRVVDPDDELLETGEVWNSAR